MQYLSDPVNGIVMLPGSIDPGNSPEPKERALQNCALRDCALRGCALGGASLAWAVAGGLAACSLVPLAALAADDDPCPRPAPGSVVLAPPELSSHNGVLATAFHYKTMVDQSGLTRFCFVAPDGTVSPTLRLDPGDRLDFGLTNDLPPPPPGSPTLVIDTNGKPCGNPLLTVTSVNVHLHGTNTAPICHSDYVIDSLTNSGQHFAYRFDFPSNEPPGLYWYHPHAHGTADAAVQGGASGAIIVNGIERIQPEVAGLPERLLIMRDQAIPNAPTPGGKVPSWDLSVNYVPILYPEDTPAVIQMRPGAREFWRVLNAAADTILDVQLRYDGVAQTLRVVALDGVPVGSQDGTRRGRLVDVQHLRVPPGGRAEFIVDAPKETVGKAEFVTLNVDTGPDGDSDPERVIGRIVTTRDAPALPVVPAASGVPAPQLFEGVEQATPTATRRLYFSEVLLDPQNPAGPTNFYVTVDGQKPALFDPNKPPAIVTHQGAVEDWTIDNRSRENHEFHIHQIHFLLLARDGDPVAPEERQFLDTIDIPYWDGSGPYPSVTVRLDFHGMDVGTFVYHCHLLGHEDAGMMATIQVLPPGN
jgi:FtsP/CotA-like multicopper oxidase with cupredoxin domain